jgi:hypothetical protein
MHRAEDKRANHGIHAFVFSRECFGMACTQVNCTALLGCAGAQIVVHIGIRFYANPVYIGAVVGKIGAAARANFHDLAAEITQEATLIGR